MSRTAFHNLLVRYLNGTCTEEERQIVQKWYSLLNENAPADINANELDIIETRIWNKLNENYRIEPAPVKSIPVYSFLTKAAVAAVIVGIILIAGYLRFNDAAGGLEVPVAKTIDHPVERTNTTNQPVQVLLEDGSKVTLEPGSSLSFPRHFETSKREVYLRGEGFFEVSRDQLRPFLVYNKNTITRVLGTSFIVRTNKLSNTTEVIVKTGKVVVMTNRTKNILDKIFAGQDNIELTPNMRTIYSIDKKKFETTLAESPVPLPSSANKDADDSFVFTESSVESVLQLLEQTYGIQIEAENSNVYKCTFTGDISDIGLYSKLDLVCQSIGVTYEIKGTKIIVKGSACN